MTTTAPSPCTTPTFSTAAGPGRRRRFQRGYLYRKSGRWYVRYCQGGKQPSQPLARVSDCPTKTQARKLADEFLTSVNRDNQAADPQLVEFVESRYFPIAETHLRASTLAGYRNLWREYLRSRLANATLGNFRTADAEQLLDVIAIERKLSRTTLGHVKAFLSGIFRFARRQGATDSGNPIKDVAIPRGKPPRETHAYTLGQIQQMLELLDEPAATIVAVAAFAGLRKGEIRGLGWSDYDGRELTVRSAWWRRTVDEPKTEKSKAAVPVIPQLAQRLDNLRKNAGDEAGRKLIFPAASTKASSADSGKTGEFPVDLDGLARSAIMPVFRASGITWHGWHAFRRGLATVLRELGVADVVTQRILRHSNVAVTQRCYIKTTDAEVQAAMDKLTAAI
jgi:integrase